MSKSKEPPPEKAGAALRRFGLLMATTFGIIGAFMLWRARPAGPYLLGGAGLLAVTAWLAPAALGPVERAWVFIGRYLGLINTFILLTLTYFLIVTPIGLLMRTFGKDPLRRRRDPKAPSYWVSTQPHEGPPTFDKPY